MVNDRFKVYDMTTWNDEHFVKVQDPPASGSNKLIFNNREDPLRGFLSYSANKTVNVMEKANLRNLSKSEND